VESRAGLIYLCLVVAWQPLQPRSTLSQPLTLQGSIQLCKCNWAIYEQGLTLKNYYFLDWMLQADMAASFEDATAGRLRIGWYRALLRIYQQFHVPALSNSKSCGLLTLPRKSPGTGRLPCVEYSQLSDL
jgi:hypothetical protein